MTMQATWNGFTMNFDTLDEAQEWVNALETLGAQDYDAAERVAYAGTDWREEIARATGATKATSKRFELGTVVGGNFRADTIGNDPEFTTFDTLEQAVSEMQDVIGRAVEMWGKPLSNGAIRDSEQNVIVWKQKAGNEGRPK